MSPPTASAAAPARRFAQEALASRPRLTTVAAAGIAMPPGSLKELWLFCRRRNTGTAVVVAT